MLACSEAGGFIRLSSMSPEAKPPWPNGQGVGPLIRRLRVRVPQEVHMSWSCAFLSCSQGSIDPLVEPSMYIYEHILDICTLDVVHVCVDVPPRDKEQGMCIAWYVRRLMRLHLHGATCIANRSPHLLSRHSSFGRASDRRSEGPRLDPGSRHFGDTKLMLCV